MTATPSVLQQERELNKELQVRVAKSETFRTPLQVKETSRSPALSKSALTCRPRSIHITVNVPGMIL